MIRGRSYGPGLPAPGGDFLRRRRITLTFLGVAPFAGAWVEIVTRTFMWFRLLLFGGLIVSLTHLVSQVRES